MLTSVLYVAAAVLVAMWAVKTARVVARILLVVVVAVILLLLADQQRWIPRGVLHNTAPANVWVV